MIVGVGIGIALALAFLWLLIETDWMRVRLLRPVPEQLGGLTALTDALPIILAAGAVITLLRLFFPKKKARWWRRAAAWLMGELVWLGILLFLRPRGRFPK